MASEKNELIDCLYDPYVLILIVVPLICILFLSIALHHSWEKSKRYRAFKEDADHLKFSSQLEEARKENEDLRNRLSEHMSNQLRDGNPNIADLSDENRPGKLVERFSELYDNEWTDATSELQAECGASYSNTEELTKDMAKLLLDILNFAFEACTEAARRQLSLIQQIMAAPNPTDDEGATSESFRANTTAALPREFMKNVKDLRKSISTDLSWITNRVGSLIHGAYSDKPFGKCLSSGPMEQYTKSCIELSWLMSVQDPPMHVKFDEKKPDRIRAFTWSGPILDYHVWPSVYLFEGGPIMKKGVAQFMTEATKDDDPLIAFEK